MSKYLAKLEADYATFRKVMAYIRGRLKEKSTLAGISAAVAAGAVVPAPYAYIIIAVGIIAVFTPEPPKK